MNALFRCVIAMLSVISIHGCGGSGSSSHSKQKAYTSPTCMDKTDLENAGIRLEGVTLKNACINQKSTQKHIVLEGYKNTWIEFNISREAHEKKIAKMFMGIRSSLSNSVLNDKDIPIAERFKLSTDIAHANLTQMIDIVRKVKIIESMHVKHSFEKKFVTRPENYLDFSIRVKFLEAGDFAQYERKAYFNNPETDREVLNSLHLKAFPEELKRTIFTESYAPREEAYSFIIKDPNTAKQ